MPPVQGRMAASAPSAPFHFTPPFRNPPDPTCGMKRLSWREVFY
ncbi:acyl-CoA dehydrogenase [Neisseria gonorrhoeae]